MGASNSCINPILYTFFNRKYRHGFIDLLRFGFCCKPKVMTGASSYNNNNAANNNNTNSNFVSCRQLASTGTTGFHNTTTNISGAAGCHSRVSGGGGCCGSCANSTTTTTTTNTNANHNKCNNFNRRNNNKLIRNKNTQRFEINMNDNLCGCSCCSATNLKGQVVEISQSNLQQTTKQSQNGVIICGGAAGNPSSIKMSTLNSERGGGIAADQQTSCSINMETLAGISGRKSVPTDKIAGQLPEGARSSLKKRTMQSITFKRPSDDDGGYADEYDEEFEDDDDEEEEEEEEEEDEIEGHEKVGEATTNLCQERPAGRLVAVGQQQQNNRTTGGKKGAISASACQQLEREASRMAAAAAVAAGGNGSGSGGSKGPNPSIRGKSKLKFRGGGQTKKAGPSNAALDSKQNDTSPSSKVKHHKPSCSQKANGSGQTAKVPKVSKLSTPPTANDGDDNSWKKFNQTAAKSSSSNSNSKKGKSESNLITTTTTTTTTSKASRRARKFPKASKLAYLLLTKQQSSRSVKAAAASNATATATAAAADDLANAKLHETNMKDLSIDESNNDDNNNNNKNNVDSNVSSSGSDKNGAGECDTKRRIRHKFKSRVCGTFSSASSGGRSLKSTQSANARDTTESTDITAISLSQTTTTNGNGYASGAGFSNSCFGSSGSQNNTNLTGEETMRRNSNDDSHETKLDKNSNFKAGEGQKIDRNLAHLPSSSSWFCHKQDNEQTKSAPFPAQTNDCCQARNQNDVEDAQDDDNDDEFDDEEDDNLLFGSRNNSEEGGNSKFNVESFAMKIVRRLSNRSAGSGASSIDENTGDNKQETGNFS